MAERKNNIPSFFEGINNPDTGKPFTPEDFNIFFARSSRIFDIELAAARATKALYLPEELPAADIPSTEPLPENQEMFFRGLSLGNLQINRVRTGNSKYDPYEISVATRSTDAQKRNLLAETIGTWGKVEEKGIVQDVRLSEDSFGFMLEGEKGITTDILDSQKNIAPFLLGFTKMRLTTKDNLIEYPNTKFLERVYTNFDNLFHFKMGNWWVRHESRKAVHMNPEQFGRYMMALLSVETVQGPKGLPFLDTVLGVVRAAPEIPAEIQEPQDPLDQAWESLMFDATKPEVVTSKTQLDKTWETLLSNTIEAELATHTRNFSI